jgi:hypothetical protein
MRRLHLCCGTGGALGIRDLRASNNPGLLGSGDIHNSLFERNIASRGSCLYSSEGSPLYTGGPGAPLISLAVIGICCKVMNRPLLQDNNFTNNAATGSGSPFYAEHPVNWGPSQHLHLVNPSIYSGNAAPYGVDLTPAGPLWELRPHPYCAVP